MEKVHNDVFFYIKKEFDSFSYKNKKKKSCYKLVAKNPHACVWDESHFF